VGTRRSALVHPHPAAPRSRIDRPLSSPFALTSPPRRVRRAWYRCCVEVFTFLRIGALVDRMSIWPLVEPGQTSSEARSAARDRFIAFDIADAQCYAADRDHLLEKIESGFDALERFNNICSQALIQRLT
jgi:hypothetical protein